jgi:hypothetical protein
VTCTVVERVKLPVWREDQGGIDNGTWLQAMLADEVRTRRGFQD